MISQMQPELSKDSFCCLHVTEVSVGVQRAQNSESSSGHILDSKTNIEQIFKVSEILMSLLFICALSV